ncbi:MAG: MBL fold metallo-hydrolase [Schwartzia succinivorans]|nr:MBL fold metallo-hydrolase [Schwartzia succinivorans]
MNHGKNLVHRFEMPGIHSNMYIIMEQNEAFIVDPNINEDALLLMRGNGVQSATVVLTHEHFDHISGVNWLRENMYCRVLCTQSAKEAIQDSYTNLAQYWDVVMMDKSPEEQEAGLLVKDENYTCMADAVFPLDKALNWHNHEIKGIAAPGHSPGGMLIRFDDVVFTGDNLVNGVGVICRLPGGKWRDYKNITLPIFSNLNERVQIYPGHGDSGDLFELSKYLVKYGAEVREET